jgi:hypothetical protein
MKLQYSTKSLLVAVLLVSSLVYALICNYRLRSSRMEIEQLRREIQSSKPITFSDFSHQLRSKLRRTTEVSIKSLSYNPALDTYTVAIQWEAPNANRQVSQTIVFCRAGTSYRGEIFIEPFAKKVRKENGETIIEPFEVILHMR